jgi:hypothetical protein
MLALSLGKGNSHGVKNGRVQTQETTEDFSERDEDPDIQNLPPYTEREDDGIYRCRRRVPKNLVKRIAKGYLYRNLGRTKKDVVGNWPDVHADVEAI